MRKHMSTKKLRFLLYPSGLLDEDLAKIEKDKAGVIWLGKSDVRAVKDSLSVTDAHEA